MKKYLFTLILFSFVPLSSCPTCIGTLEPDSPAFFADELYQSPYTEVEVDLDTLLDD